MEEASSILAFSTMRVTNKKPQNTLNQKTDSREPPILLRDLRLFKWSLKWTCGVSSNTSLALCPSPNQLQMHYNWYLNNYKGEGWCWASFPSLPIADLRCYLQGVNKPARSLGHPSVISNSCSETLPVPIFLPMYLLIRSQASRQGGGASLWSWRERCVWYVWEGKPRFIFHEAIFSMRTEPFGKRDII